MCIRKRALPIYYRRLTRLFFLDKELEACSTQRLLDGALGTAFLELLLSGFDFFLLLAREDGERNVRDGILRFLQAQVGETTHNLNDSNALVGFDFVNDEVELSLFLDGFGGSRARRHHHTTRRGGGVNAEHFFDLLDELGGFKELRAM